MHLKAFIMRKRLEARKEMSSLHSFKNPLVIGHKTGEYMQLALEGLGSPYSLPKHSENSKMTSKFIHITKGFHCDE